MEKTFALYAFIHEDLGRKGHLLADTKWEFGYMPDGTIDECVTPDSSRFWTVGDYTFNPAKNDKPILSGTGGSGWSAADNNTFFFDHMECMPN